MAVKIGAIAAGAKPSQVNALSEFAEAIGVAFQIQDDVLNLTAGEESKKEPGGEYGKEIGGDISEGKMTLMVIYALKHSPSASRLLQILKAHTKEPRLILESIDIIKECGAIDYARAYAKKIVGNAWSRADKVLKNSEGKRKLKALADYLIERSY